jgi:hypothetical protein
MLVATMPSQLPTGKLKKGRYKMKISEISIIATSLFGLCLLSGLDTSPAYADFTFGEPVNLKEVIPLIDPVHESIDCFSYDGLEIYIQSDRPGGSGDYDMWRLRRDSLGEDWGPPENLGPLVNSQDVDSQGSISMDGLTLYFGSSLPGGYGKHDIYMTTRTTRNDPWGQAVNMGPNINTSSVDACPWISPDGLELYISSLRPGGYGDVDIYVTRRVTQNDPWGELENLGPIVNSAYGEVACSLSLDGRVLFFSGRHGATYHRPGGYGGSDLWMTIRKSPSEPWQTPLNLGSIVNNSTHGDLPRLSPDNLTLYFATNSGGIWDNWQAPIEPIVDLNGDDMCIIVDNCGTDNPLCDIGPMPWGDGIVDVQDLIVLAEHLFEEIPPVEPVE